MSDLVRNPKDRFSHDTLKFFDSKFQDCRSLYGFGDQYVLILSETANDRGPFEAAQILKKTLIVLILMTSAIEPEELQFCIDNSKLRL